jgi:hypothetical protein
MPRFAVNLTLQEFKDKCEEIFDISNGEFDPYEFPETINKDLSKLDFSFENWCIGNASPNYSKYPNSYTGFCEYPVGYEVLSNNLPVLFVNAGGDWENPICFCIYWDGKQMRAYIPKDGNVYNVKAKSAYGNDDDDMDDLPDGDKDKIRLDVVNRIKIK